MSDKRSLIFVVFRIFDANTRAAKLARLLPLWSLDEPEDVTQSLIDRDLWEKLVEMSTSNAGSTKPPIDCISICPADITANYFALMPPNLRHSVTMIYPIIGSAEEKRFIAHQWDFFDLDHGQELLFSLHLDPTRTRVCVPLTDLKIPLVIPSGKRELDYLPARLRVKEIPPKPPVFPELCPDCLMKLHPTNRFRSVSAISGTEKEFCECQACGSLFCALDDKTVVYSRSRVIHHGT